MMSSVYRRLRPGQQGIHLHTPAIESVADVPAGLAALIVERKKITQELKKLKVTLASLNAESSKLQEQRVAAQKKGDRELAEELVSELQDLLHRIAVLQHHIPKVEKQKEQLGWRMDVERRRELEKENTTTE